MSENRLHFNEGNTVRIETTCGIITLSKEDGGLWMVILSMTKDPDDGKRIGAIFDQGWEYSDQSAKHPGFMPLDGWNSCVPGMMILPGNNRRIACRTLTQAALRVANWYFAGQPDDLLATYQEDDLAVAKGTFDLRRTCTNLNQ